MQKYSIIRAEIQHKYSRNNNRIAQNEEGDGFKVLGFSGFQGFRVSGFRAYSLEHRIEHQSCSRAGKV